MSKIRVKDLIGAEVRSRIPIALLKKAIAECKNYDIDMADVTFISRSFADELYNLQQDYMNVHFLNLQEDVKKMIDAVWGGREKERVRPKDSVSTENLSSIEEFSNFLMGI